MIIDKVYKQILPNGLTVLVVPNHRIPKVSTQLWYNVGSKDEKSSQKGIAHLIEHMIFKGTNTLSESDINLITHKLSGYCNAFTSHDYTGYLFDFPAQNWHEALPIMADCMRNCTFKEELLNSELKAVIQELKMYNDDYSSVTIEKMLGSIFEDHPYRYPIIGYKRDLWSLKREELLKFYQEHYVPNNAVLIIVGDVQVQDAFFAAERAFGKIQPNSAYKKEQFYHGADLSRTATTIWRDVKQPSAIVAFVVPGVQDKQDYLLDLLSWVISSGKGSRLYRKIVDELGLATALEGFLYDLFEYSLFLIEFQPKAGVNPEEIIAIINQEIDAIVRNGFTAPEIVRAIKKTEMDTLALKENNQKLAYLIGKYYLALADEQYLSCYDQIRVEDVPDRLHALVSTYLRAGVMHQGLILPLPQGEIAYWQAQQEQSDQEDSLVLSRITRDVQVEDGLHVVNITTAPPKSFQFPQAESFELSNGLKVLYHHQPGLPKIDLILDFRAKHYFDPDDRQGLLLFLFDMLQEGTAHYSAAEFAQELEQYGMSLNTFPGHIAMNMLSADAPRGFALLRDMVTNVKFEPSSIEKVRDRILSDVLDFWDTPAQLAVQLVREQVYEGHPYQKRLLGDANSIRSITQQDLQKAYRDWISPQSSRIAVVGDLSGYDVKDFLEKTLGAWSGPQVADLNYPKLVPNSKPITINYPINRDQITLCFARLSIDRLHPDFDKLLLFDQIFSGGVLGSMSSRLFELRERSGLFYTIGGSLLAGTGKQPGMLFVKTIVSQEQLNEAERQIKAVIDRAAQDLTQEELVEAQQAVINSQVDHFASNAQMASTFLFLDFFGFPKNYFDYRAKQLLAVTRQEVQDAAARLMKSDALIIARVGRVE